MARLLEKDRRKSCAVAEADRYRRWCRHGDPLITRHTFSGVTGMSMWVTPNSDSASTTAFITDGSAPAQPASPQPFTPSRLVLQGTEWFCTDMSGASEARGRA